MTMHQIAIVRFLALTLRRKTPWLLHPLLHLLRWLIVRQLVLDHVHGTGV